MDPTAWGGICSAKLLCGVSWDGQAHWLLELFFCGIDGHYGQNIRSKNGYGTASFHGLRAPREPRERSLSRAERRYSIDN